MPVLKGNAIVGQSGGPTAAINATLSGVIRGCCDAAKNGTIGTVYGMKNGIDGLINGKYIDLSYMWEDEDQLSLLENTPAAALGSCRRKLPDPNGDSDVYPKLIELFKKLDIRYFFYIGGNDSMDTAAKLDVYAKRVGYDMRVMGVPKTVDNDLCETDHTPGFGSAAKYIATTVTEVIADCAVYDIPAVTVIEIMGRDTGWLTSAAGAGAAVGNPIPDLIYFPEKVFDLEKLYSDVEKALAKHPNVVIAVSEGIRFADGSFVGEDKSGAVDVFGHKQLSGAAKVVASAIKAKFGCKTRGIELNTVQRCANHIASLTDLKESVKIGSEAVKSAVNGASGCTVVYKRVSDEPYEVRYETADVRLIANRVKYLPDSFINADENGITEDCLKYLLPLMAGETSPTYERGIIKHFTFR
ncbi:MAG: 6-phosphofructokinase [Ruminococcaceae bacterium]|nr:6-phosphofructokinase [Oscillospiraceae bacterium]